MKLAFSTATPSDAASLAALHRDVADHLTRQFGPGGWSCSPTERMLLAQLRKKLQFSQILIARTTTRTPRLAATLHLATKKPWAIDTAYFTPVTRPLYLTSMAVHPDLQRQGIGRAILKHTETIARSWPADVIRLDAFDAPAGAGPFYTKCGFDKLAHATYKGGPLIYFELLLRSRTPKQ